MEKELENRFNKIDESIETIKEEMGAMRGEIGTMRGEMGAMRGEIDIIKVNVEEGFRETREKLSKLEIRINDTYNAVDGFIKIVTKLEDEFAAMKADIKRVKEVIKEKLGVDLF